ncbi:X-Pro dipeptidyl-peptidase [Tamaricihabitans halophyticus]|uniref:X-Pro dipeptidyl-peptidase n=1 Tax=Tamaricihabitans halophyticus TaxID=1262583 RepID=A0A4R2QFE1_9PSEU|nr:X-Pro dipeptidyl-peptidase [Tamaricihabitans halophyticus]
MVLAGLSGAATAQPTQSAQAQPYSLSGGVTEPIYSYAGAVRESVWVDTGTEVDGDGHPDRVAVDIIRPAEPAAAGQRISTIVEVSPYYACCGRGNEAQLKGYAPDGTPERFPLFYDNYFVPRGYAVALVDAPGTNRSTGCSDNGGPLDNGAGKAVVDWLGGRAQGYDAVRHGKPVTADWASGTAGMIGKSADGWAANGVATTGVEGLRTIVPIGGVTSLYRHFNADGASGGYPPGSGEPKPPDPDPTQEKRCAPFHDELAEQQGEQADWNRYWAQRDHAPQANGIRASVFVVHGLGDVFNAPTRDLQRWWTALGDQGVGRKLWLGQAGHVDPFDFRRGPFVKTLHRWFDRWLYDIDNGIDTEPPVLRESKPDTWVPEQAWPPADTQEVTLWPNAGAGSGPGGLARTPAPSGTDSFVDDPELSRFDWVLDPEASSPARVVYRTEPLPHDIRLSGTPSVRVTASSTTDTARVGAAIVDYGRATIRDYLGDEQGIRTLPERSCWGASTPADSACYLETEIALTDVDHEIIASGAAELGNWATLGQQLPLTPGRFYPKSMGLSAVDHVVPAGNRLAIVLGGTDAQGFFAPSQRPEIELDLTRTSVTLPLAPGS